jgi:hypothetical protein
MCKDWVKKSSFKMMELEKDKIGDYPFGLTYF